MASKIIPVIMCGGAGTRLWPASRENMPKQFIPLLSQNSMFQDTIARVRKDDVFEKPIVITNASFRFLVADQLDAIGVAADIVLEPVRRDSAPAVAVASLLGLQRDKDSLLLVLAADHVINDVDQFHDSCVRSRAAAEKGSIVTFGVVPTEPSPAYGYLSPGAEIESSGVRKLLSFAEKPDRDRARSYIEQGYLWNSGNFLFRADVMLDELARFQPELHQAAERAVRAATTDADFIRLGETEFGQAPKISIDYAVMERTDKSAVLACQLWLVGPRQLGFGVGAHAAGRERQCAGWSVRDNRDVELDRSERLDPDGGARACRRRCRRITRRRAGSASQRRQRAQGGRRAAEVAGPQAG